MKNLSTFVRTSGNQFIAGKKFFTTSIAVFGTLADGVNSVGTAGQVLVSTATGVVWTDFSAASNETLDSVTDRGNTTTNSITIGGLRVDDTTLYVDATNNRVGIGTLTPQHTFHVEGGAFADYFQLDTTYSNGDVPGRFTWDPDSNTALLGLDNDISLRVGQDDMWFVKNQSGATIEKGSVVYASGTLGTSGRILISKMIADGSIPARNILGITAEDIANGADGYVLAKGKIRQLNTSAFADGQVLWVSSTTAGALTDTEPSAPNLKLPVAFVVHANANGTLAVRVETGVKISDASDVQVTSVANKNILRYNSSTLRWENVAGTTSSIDEGTNLYYTDARARAALSAGTGISYNSTTGVITNSAPDQTVVVTAGTGISVLSGYPNFTITNTAPDQVVALTGAGTTVVTGTYPNFTITSNDQYVGTVTSVGLSVPTGFTVSGSPVTTSGTFAVGFATGYSLPTDASQANWNTAYNTRIVSAAVSGTTTKTLTLTRGDSTTIQATWTDYDTAPVTSVNGQTGVVVLDTDDIAEGTSNLYFTTSRARSSVSAGTGISYNSTTGVITNSAPDQTVSITGAGTSVVTGTYPNFTVTSNDQYNGTVTSVGVAAGTGIAVSGSPITSSGTITVTNTAPDQVVGLSAGTGIQVTGTYPNFTITNTSPSSGGTLTGGGTVNYVSKWSSATNLVDSQIFDNGTDVGIGTSSPFVKFDVRGEAMLLYRPAGNAYAIYSAANNTYSWQLGINNGSDFIITGGGFTGLGTERLRITSDGNVGIGTTSPANLLHLYGTDGNSYLRWTSDVATTGTRIGYNGTEFRIDQQQNAAIAFRTNSTEAMRITSGGTLIVGDTVVPSETAWLGTAVFGKNTYNKVIIGSLNSITTGAYVGGHNSALNNWADLNIAGTALIFRTNETERMRLASNGNFGIGTTSPNRNLTVSGNGTLLGLQSSTVGGYSEIEMTANGVSAGYIFKNSAGYSSYAGAGSLNIYNSGSIGFHTASATNAMFIASATGNVGIGTALPAAKLQVGGAFKLTGGDWPTGYAGLELNYITNTAYIGSYDRTNSVYKKLFLFSEDLTLETGGVIRQFITSGGNVLIGTTTDAGYKLRVNGTTMIDSTLRLVGNMTVGGDTSQWSLTGVANGGAIWQKSHSGAGGSDDRYLRLGNVDNNGTPNYVLTIFNSNVGIGTTSPFSRLTVARNGINEGTISYEDESNNAHLTVSGSDAFVRLQFGTYNNGSFSSWIQSSYDNSPGGSGSSGAQGLAINPQGGNVGIGTTAPSDKLDITDGKLRFTNTSSGRNSTIGMDDNFNFYIKNTPFGNLYIGNGTTTYVTGAFNAGSGSVVIQTGGNVGIGTTSPSYKLQVQGDSYVGGNFTSTGYGFFNGEGLGASLRVGGIYSNLGLYVPSSYDMQFDLGWDGVFKFTRGNSERMRIVGSTGNVGIGTTAPSSKLTVTTSNRSFEDSENAIRIEYLGSPSNGEIGGGLVFAQRWFSGAPDSLIRTGGIYGVKTSGNGTFGGGLVFYTQPNSGDPMNEHMRITSAGNVGIGTTSPGTKLHIVGGNDNTLTIDNDGSTYTSAFWRNNNNNRAQIYFQNGAKEFGIGTLDASGYLAFQTGVASERMRITSAGNVGIGTTSPATRLDVSGGVTSSGSANPYFALNNGTAVSYLQVSSGALNVRVGGANPIIFTADSSELMRITSAGNVGIGTTSPQSRLDLGVAPAQSTTSTLGYSANASLNIRIPNVVGDVGQIVFTNDAAPTSGYASIGVVMTSGAGVGLGDIIMSTKSVGSDAVSTERMRITSAGNVGIGTTAPAQKLHVVGSRILVQDATNAGLMINTGGVNRYSVASTGSAFQIYDEANSTNRLYITSDGNIGIGTISPSLTATNRRILSVNGTSSSLIELKVGDLWKGYLYRDVNRMEIYDSSAIDLSTNGSIRATITSAGNVGIGTTSPVERLHVVGSGVFTGTLTASGAYLNNSNAFVWNQSPSGILRFGTNNTEQVRIDASGNVGIGTTSPAYKLEVDVTDSTAYSSLNTLAAGTPLWIYNNSTTSSVASTIRLDAGQSGGNGAATISSVHVGSGSSAITFGTRNSGSNVTERVRIDNSGNVGIGTTSPSQKLHVDGSARVTGAYYDSSNSSGTSGQVLSSTGSGTQWVAAGSGSDAQNVLTSNAQEKDVTGFDFSGLLAQQVVMTGTNIRAYAPVTINTDNSILAIVTFEVATYDFTDGKYAFQFYLESGGELNLSRHIFSQDMWALPDDSKGYTTFTYHMLISQTEGNALILGDAVNLMVDDNYGMSPLIVFASLSLQKAYNY